MKTEPAADAGRLKVERFRPLPAGDGAAPAMHDSVGQWTTRPPASSRIIGSVLNAAPGFPRPKISSTFGYKCAWPFRLASSTFPPRQASMHPAEA
jgi:hypothetical protein